MIYRTEYPYSRAIYRCVHQQGNTLTLLAKQFLGFPVNDQDV